MKEQPIKKYPTIACCGLDCGSCPTYYTKGPSRCPGCCGTDFFQKHPSCSSITCCVKNKDFETCAECEEFPCSKIDKWDAGDSFISHMACLSNLRYIKTIGIEKFFEIQKRRIEMLERMLEQYNEGRSKSFYCIAAALLSVDDLEEALKTSEEQIKIDNISKTDLKSKSKLLKGILNGLATKDGIILKLRKK